jgi:hypothetical protein
MIKKMDHESGERKIREALEIIEALGLPRQQQNERFALTLLSLLDIKPADRWQYAGNPLIGITPMMEFFEENYGKRYAPNTRETVRRQTVHQFMQAALIVPNPEKPSRPNRRTRQDARCCGASCGKELDGPDRGGHEPRPGQSQAAAGTEGVVCRIEGRSRFRHGIP